MSNVTVEAARRIVWPGSLGMVIACGLVTSGCSDNELLLRKNNSVAVTIGDFDEIAAPLNRMIVKHSDYDGVISTTTWDPDYDRGLSALTVEGLFGSFDEMKEHDAIFVASGTRGFGARQYNGLEADDQIVASPEAIENCQNFVAGGGSLVVTDWAYDLVEAAWPEYVTFLNEGGELDAAQRGEEGTILGTVVFTPLAEAMETESLSLKYNFSNWAVIESVELDKVEVLIRGDVSYLNNAGTGSDALTQAPLLVRFEPPGGLGGQVVYANFHIDAQNDFAMDQMLRTVVGRFKENDPEALAIEN
jgi:hypothetical protein